MRLAFIIRKFIEHGEWIDYIQTVSYPVIASMLALCCAFFANWFSNWWVIPMIIMLLLVILGLFMIDRNKRNHLGVYHIDMLEDLLKMKKSNKALRKKVRDLEFKLYQKVI